MEFKIAPGMLSTACFPTAYLSMLLYIKYHINLPSCENFISDFLIIPTTRNPATCRVLGALSAGHHVALTSQPNGIPFTSYPQVVYSHLAFCFSFFSRLF